MDVRPPLIYSDSTSTAVYCPQCGKENPGGSIYCGYCGTLIATTIGTSAPPGAAMVQGSRQGQGRNSDPLMAGVLNLFFGLGYVYLGYGRVMKVQVAVFVVLMVALYFLAGVITDGLAGLVLAALLAVDGYQKASGLKGYINAEKEPYKSVARM